MSPDQNKRNSVFTLLRSIVWPVHRSECKKVLSMLLLLFLLCVCYSMLRSAKDTIILTATASGAEVIPFIKVWGMLPGAFAITWCYTRLTRRFGGEAVFYMMVSGFLVYYLFFAFVLFPNSHTLHLDRVGDWLTEVLPTGSKGFIALLRNWTFTTFYVLSELWSVVVLTILFWGFANGITEVKEAQRTYGILNVGSNLAPIAGGALGILFSNHIHLPFLSNAGGNWQIALQQIVLLVTILGVVSMIVFYQIHRMVDKEGNQSRHLDTLHIRKDPCPRLSIRASIRYISRSKYLVCLAMIVVAYSISINLTDVLWKAQLKDFFPDPSEMNAHMNMITMWIGVLGTLGGICFAFIVHRWGWTLPAILTPTLMIILAIGFFGVLFYSDTLFAWPISLLGVSPLACTVYFGSMQNCVSKAGKYSVFDASKELAFLPLAPEARLKGKAAIDGLGSGIGKSGASLTYQGLILLLGNITLSTPYVALTLGMVFCGWIYSVLFIGRQFKTLDTTRGPDGIHSTDARTAPSAGFVD